MKTRGIAYVNHGRWLVDCPECGAPVPFDPKDGAAVCGVCFPGITAMAFAKRMDKYGRELYVPVPDTEKREEAMKKAKSFKPVMPDDWKSLYEELRKRHISKMNWLPGETLNDLRAENILHGLEKV